MIRAITPGLAIIKSRICLSEASTGKARFFSTSGNFAAKRGAGQSPVRVTNADARIDVDLAEMIALDDALERLGKLNPRLPRVVELRFFTGLNEDEIAEVLGVTSRTVQRDWATARAWLYKELATANEP